MIEILMQYKRIKLDIPYTIVALSYQTGSMNDPEGKEGIAHLVEHLFLKNSDVESLERLGVQANGFIDHESSVFYHLLKPEQTFASVKTLLSSINKFDLDDGALEKEKNIVLDEKSRVYNDETNIIDLIARSNLYKSSYLGRSVFGSVNSLKNIVKSDVIDFFNHYYKNKPEHIFIIGPELEKDNEIEEFLDKYSFLEVQKGKFINNKSEEIAREENQRSVGIAYKINIGNDLKSLAALDLLREYMSNHWSSIGNQILRQQKGFTYWVNGYSERHLDDVYLRFMFYCDDENKENAVKLLLSEIEKIKVNEKLFNACRESYKLNLLLSNYSVQEILYRYVYPITKGLGPVELNSYLQILDQVGVSSLNELSLADPVLVL